MQKGASIVEEAIKTSVLEKLVNMNLSWDPCIFSKGCVATHSLYNLNENVSCFSDRLLPLVFSSCPGPDKPASLRWIRPGGARARPARKSTLPQSKLKLRNRSFLPPFF
jgi:hypothetical protein